VNVYADPMFAKVEIDRRLELFGVADQLHYLPSPERRPGAVRRLVDHALHALRPTRPTVASAGRPRHP
jgi:hypothetical protein